MSGLPVVVDVNHPAIPRYFTSAAVDLSFTKVAPGGDSDMQVRLNMDPNVLPEMGPADRIYVMNPRTGKPLWAGYVTNPGRSELGFDIGATGGKVVASGAGMALTYVDRMLDQWVTEKAATTAVASTAGTSDDPTGVDAGSGLLHQFPPGQPIATNAAIKSTYVFGDQQFGGLILSKKAGLASTDYATTLVTQGTSGVVFADLAPIGSVETTIREHANWAGPAGTPGQIAEGIKRLSLQFYRDGAATNVATDTVWVWWQPVVFGRRMNRYGTLLVGPHAETAMIGVDMPECVAASEVVEDLLGRLLSGQCDAVLAEIETTAARIDQLAYRDAATAATILEDLSLWEADHVWMIQAPKFVDGKHRFSYTSWGTEPRYVIRAEDDYEAQGGEVDLCNRIDVSWVDETGQQQVTTISASVPELDDRGRIRAADPIELPEGVGSLSAAQAIGSAELEQLNRLRGDGQARISTPILDRRTGVMVDPYEVEPGCLAQVQETGETLRVTQVTYDDEDAVSTVTLGTPMLTTDQRIAALASRRRR